MTILLGWLLPILTNKWVVVVGGCIAVFVVLILMAYHAGYTHGADDVAEAVREQNDRAEDAGNEAINDVFRCHDAGREWDVSRGVCE